MGIELSFAASIEIERPADEVYAAVSDVTRMGEWSPQCVACWWDEGDGPRTGAWFTGRNQTPTRTWETRSEVVDAVPGTRFAFKVGGAWVHWAYAFEALTPESMRLTESWEFLPAGLTRFTELYGDEAAHQIEIRRQAAYEGIPATLAAIKRVLELNVRQKPV